MCGLILVDRRYHGTAFFDLNEAVQTVARRGPHSHGWATFHPEPHVTHNDGPLRELPTGDWIIALGHSRLATSGAHPGALPDANDGQPIPHRKFILAHNGTLPQHTNPHISDSQAATEKCETINDVRTVFQSPNNDPQCVIVVDQRLRVCIWRTGRNGGHPLYITDHPEARLLTSIPVHPTSELVASEWSCWDVATAATGPTL